MLWKSHYKFPQVSPDISNGYIQRLLQIRDPFLFLRNDFRRELVFYPHKLLKSVILFNFGFVDARMRN